MSDPSGGPPRRAVVHLVWAPLGAGPVRAFLDAYGAQPAGVEHELVVVLNGQGEPGAPPGDWLARELEGTPHRLMALSRPVQDLEAYGEVLGLIDHDRVCVLNSYSRPLVEGWLMKMDAALERPGAGIVGASGSWASPGALAMFRLGLPSGYRRAYPDRAGTIRQFTELAYERSGRRPGGGLRGRVDLARALARQAIAGPRFPEPHLRTNGFMGSRELLASLMPARLRDKEGALRTESGRHSVTRAIRRLGLLVTVVDRDGRTYEPEAWPDSVTFWQGGQERLLIADNQTDFYRDGDPARRRLLSRFAWGERALPVAGPERG